MKHKNNIAEKFIKSLNKNSNNVKVDFKTNYNLIKHVNNRTKNFTKNPLYFKNAGIYKLKC
jgi:hypothetical protein